MNKARENEIVSAFDALLEAAVDAIVIIDDTGKIRRFNRAAERIFGYSEKEVCGMNVSLLMPEPHKSAHDRYLEQFKEKGIGAIIGVGREEFGLRKSGETFPMFLSVGESRQKVGRRYVGIIRDLSDVRATQEQVKQLEEQLVHADRLVVLGELTAGIAHEINQPLTAIAAYADAGRHIVARGEDASPGEMQSICKRISEQSRRAAEVVQRLRKLVRSGAVSKSRHNINQIIKNILLLFEYELKKTKTELIFLGPEPSPELYVDEIHIQQVLVNLVKNSLDAITSSESHNGRIEIRVVKSGTEVSISVTDNGPGVPEQFRDKLFESFFTTKPTGVGLGLSICKSIAGAHGGNLRYSVPSGGGARFTLSLPLGLIG